MRVFSYVVANDGGFAPNPFHGVCTLACCKPKIRASAEVGDLVIGLTKRSERLVYMMLGVLPGFTPDAARVAAFMPVRSFAFGVPRSLLARFSGDGSNSSRALTDPT